MLIRMLAVFVLGTVVSLRVSAMEVNAWPCNGCTETQLQSAAANRGIGTHYIYDFYHANLRKYEVTREADLMPGAIVFLAEELPVPVELQGKFSDMVEVRQSLGDLSKILVEVSVGPGDPIAGHTAFDVARNGSVRNDISDWLRAYTGNILERAGLTSSLSGNLLGLLQGMDKVFTQGELLTIDVVITLTDGSKVTFEFSPESTTEGYPEYKDNSAVDENNNPVLQPGQTPAVGTEYSFRRDNSERALQDWLNHMCSIVRCVSSSAGSTPIRACTYSREGVVCITY